MTKKEIKQRLFSIYEQLDEVRANVSSLLTDDVEGSLNVNIKHEGDSDVTNVQLLLSDLEYDLGNAHDDMQWIISRM